MCEATPRAVVGITVTPLTSAGPAHPAGTGQADWVQIIHRRRYGVEWEPTSDAPLLRAEPWVNEYALCDRFSTPARLGP